MGLGLYRLGNIIPVNHCPGHSFIPVYNWPPAVLHRYNITGGGGGGQDLGGNSIPFHRFQPRAGKCNPEQVSG